MCGVRCADSRSVFGYSFCDSTDTIRTECDSDRLRLFRTVAIATGDFNLDFSNSRLYVKRWRGRLTARAI